MRTIKKATGKVTGLFTIMLIVFVAVLVLGYALYLLYNITKKLKTNESPETKEVAEEPAEAGEREIPSPGAAD